jgi:hypothetical protein
MQPADLRAESFALYPEQARGLAVANISILQTLPLALLPVLLRSLQQYDWKFPPERRELTDQLHFLNALSTTQRDQLLSGFATIAITKKTAEIDWVNHPASFIEDLTASLWSKGQMEGFRKAADDYSNAVSQAYPTPLPQQPRLAVVVVGAGVQADTYPVFRKLRPQGLLLTNVDPADGREILSQHVNQRVPREHLTDEAQLRHWAIDGADTPQSSVLTSVSYSALQRPRELLLDRIQKAIATGSMGPEQLRSLLAALKPSDIGLGTGASPNATQLSLDYFRMSLLTEGAGTQIFATTFVQWAARECIRRAQPETVFIHYAPRQQAQTLDTMLAGHAPEALDPPGSLVDADMGAYYTWLSMRRLTGSEDTRFLAWFEGHGQAVLIGPGLPRGTSSDSRMSMQKVLALL